MSQIRASGRDYVRQEEGYDVREVIGRLVDHGDFLEVQAGYTQNLVVGFGRLIGRTVGVISNQPNVMSGVLDINSSDKGSQFIRFCNAFNIPLLTLVDVPGFMPGVAPGARRHHSPRCEDAGCAYSAASVPKITVVLRKSYGGAYPSHVLEKTWEQTACSHGRPLRLL